MTTPAAAVASISTSLDLVTGLRPHTIPPGSIKPPAALVDLARIEAPSTLGSASGYTIRVTLLVQLGDLRNSNERLMTLIDPNGTTTASAFAALLSNNGVGQVTFEGPSLLEFGGQQYAGGTFTVGMYG